MENVIRSNKNSRIKSEKSKSTVIFMTICCVLLALYTFTLVMTIGWALMNSFKDPVVFGAAGQYYISLPTGEAFRIANYVEVFQYFSVPVRGGRAYLLDMIINSILYSVGCALLQTIACCFMAYIVSRYENVVSKIVYTIVLVVMILPIVGQLASEVQILSGFGLYDNMLGTYLLSFNFLGMHFLVFHATFKAIPKDYTEAAMIDGAGHWRIFLMVMMPLAKMVFFTIFLLKFIVYWNDYQTPLVYMPNHPVLAYGLHYMQNGSGNQLGGENINTVPHKLAAAMLIFLPIFVLFMFVHKRLIGNVSMGGIKG